MAKPRHDDRKRCASFALLPPPRPAVNPAVLNGADSCLTHRIRRRGQGGIAMVEHPLTNHESKGVCTKDLELASESRAFARRRLLCSPHAFWSIERLGVGVEDVWRSCCCVFALLGMQD